MKKYALIAAFIVIGSISSAAQSACPSDKVCISPEAARSALEAGDKVKALEAARDALLKAIDDHKNIENDLKVALAKITGEKTGSDEMVVRLSAIVEFLLKNTKARSKFGVINF